MLYLPRQLKLHRNISTFRDRCLLSHVVHINSKRQKNTTTSNPRTFYLNCGKGRNKNASTKQLQSRPFSMKANREYFGRNYYPYRIPGILETLQKEMRVIDSKVNSIWETQKPLVMLGISPLVFLSCTHPLLLVLNGTFFYLIYKVTRFIPTEKLRKFCIRCQDHFGPEGETLVLSAPIFFYWILGWGFDAGAQLFALPILCLTSLIISHWWGRYNAPGWIRLALFKFQNRKVLNNAQLNQIFFLFYHTIMNLLAYIVCILACYTSFKVFTYQLNQFYRKGRYT